MIYVCTTIILIEAFVALVYFINCRIRREREDRRNRPLLDPADFKAELRLLTSVVSEIAEVLSRQGKWARFKCTLPKGYKLKSGILDQINVDVDWVLSDGEKVLYIFPLIVCEIFQYGLSESDLAVVYHQVQEFTLSSDTYRDKVRELVDQLPFRKKVG